MSKNDDFDDSPVDLDDVYDKIEITEKVKIKAEGE